MRLPLARFFGIAVLTASALQAQESVCGLFKDLKAADGRQMILTGDLILSKSLAAIGATDCDNRYISAHYMWPTALRLRPSSMVPPDQIRRFQAAAREADRLRMNGKTVAASGSFTGRFELREDGDLPGEFTFDSLDDLKVDALPDAASLPVVPICDLFQNLTAWKGQRIAVRGEVVGTSEGSWLSGRCRGGFYTDGYRWPVSLSYAGHAYASQATAPFVKVKVPSSKPKGWESFRGRYSVTLTATYVGRLRMREVYRGLCRAPDDYLANGFGHQAGAAAEIVVEEIRDEELTKPQPDDAPEDRGRCSLPDLTAQCATAPLARAAALGCTVRVAELLSKQGIDSKDGNASAALSQAIRVGNDDLVKILLNAGAPVNPAHYVVFPPLTEAAQSRKLDVMRTLLKAGAHVDEVDRQGATYLSAFGFFDDRVLKVLLDAGANPNAADDEGQTALMQAANYGYENAVILLIDHGAAVNQRDHKGRSALMYAANGEYVDAIPHLLSHGADPGARDSDGKTALDLARQSKNGVAIEILSGTGKH